MKFIHYKDVFYNTDKIKEFYYIGDFLHIIFDDDKALSIIIKERDYYSFIKYLKDDEAKVINIKDKL